MLVFTSAAEAAIQKRRPEESDVLRLDISPRGCGAPVITVEPDRALASDFLFMAGGRTICVDASLCQKTKSITLDVCNGRFTVSLAEPVTVDGCGLCPASPLQGGRCGIIDGMNF